MEFLAQNNIDVFCYINLGVFKYILNYIVQFDLCFFFINDYLNLYFIPEGLNNKYTQDIFTVYFKQ